MEIYVMKKKFVLVLALVLIVATTVAFAGDIKFSGRVRQGYTFTFKNVNGTASTSVAPQKTKEGKLAIKVSDADGLWTLSFGNVGPLDSDDKLAASASVDLSKALAATGVDLGDVSVAYTIGNNTADTVLNTYADGTSKHYQRIKTNGTMVSTVTVGYGSLVSVKLAADPTTATKTFAASSIITPVDGVKFSVAYGNNVKIQNGTVAAKNAIGGDANIDMAKLAGLGFKCAVSGGASYGIDEKNLVAFAQVSGGVDAVDGFVEYAYTVQKANYVKAQVNFNMVDGLGIDAYAELPDLAKISDKALTVGGDVSYTLGGVSYSLNVENGYTATTKTNVFTITPAVAISF
jgi:hypothetical protein